MHKERSKSGSSWMSKFARQGNTKRTGGLSSFFFQDGRVRKALAAVAGYALWAQPLRTLGKPHGRRGLERGWTRLESTAMGAFSSDPTGARGTLSANTCRRLTRCVSPSQPPLHVRLMCFRMLWPASFATGKKRCWRCTTAISYGRGQKGHVGWMSFSMPQLLAFERRLAEPPPSSSRAARQASFHGGQLQTMLQPSRSPSHQNCFTRSS